MLTLLALPLVAGQLVPSQTYNPPGAAAGNTPSTGSPNAQWSAVLGNSLWFYDAQRSGRLDAGAYPNRVAWRQDSAVNDGEVVGLDLSGGWYDAGDWIKATYPLGVTMWALSWSAMSYGPGFEAANQTAYMDSTLRWGYDWLMKVHPTDDTLFVQVGASAHDGGNAYWGPDGGLARNRACYAINASYPGTDAWASTAGAFAMGSLAYQGTQWNTSTSAWGPAPLANASYSAQLLKHGETLYRVAKENDKKSFTDSIKNIGAAYVPNSFGDDLCTAALALAAATNNSAYYAEAYNHYTNYSLSRSGAVWNWDSRVPAAYVLFAELAAARPGLAAGAGLDANLTGWQTEVEGWIERSIAGDAGRTYISSAGLLFWVGDSDEASLNPAMAFAALLLRYAPLASSTDKAKRYRDFAATQIDYLMGKNPMNVPYIVGMHPNSPPAPHVVRGSGLTDESNLRDPPTNKETLYGAVPGGPRPNDLWWPWRDDWVQNEIALDYNANLPALAAYQLATGAGDPYYVGVTAGYTVPAGQPCDAALPCKKGLSGGAIAGIVIGCLAAVVLAGLAIWLYRRRR
ncbi:hypothetical protein CspHIS471_0603320 [Cutaneotrichosporon sp. HIS471]|nr:hypothetical protein CspHIS471_0603320 [Cutaneotrichosporon sp. HIS471]